jgi:hypothetical protein
MNETIAIFEGWRFIKGDPNHKCNFCFAGDEPCTPAMDRFLKDSDMRFRFYLQYHSSWDWLMPVWFKIQTIGADMGYSFKKFHEAFYAGIDHQSIEKCHKAVYQFLTWLNQQKQKDGTETT